MDALGAESILATVVDDELIRDFRSLASRVERLDFRTAIVDTQADFIRLMDPVMDPNFA